MLPGLAELSEGMEESEGIAGSDEAEGMEGAEGAWSDGMEGMDMPPPMGLENWARAGMAEDWRIDVARQELAQDSPAQQEHRRLILPIIGAVKQRAAEHAIAEDAAGRDQRDGGEDDDDGVAQRQRALQRRHGPMCRSGVGAVIPIRKRTVHQAETSEASFSRLAAVAVFAP